MKPIYTINLAFATLFLAGCTGNSFTYKDFPVSKGSAAAGAGNTVAFRGSPLPLEGNPIKVADTLRDAKVAGLPSPASAMPSASGSMGGSY